ncbi:MAG: VIT1/CCC1 transporter family protein [Nanoarchaeota archaeon]
MEKPIKKFSFVNSRIKNVIRDFVFGMEDGLVSNLGLVLGVYIGGGNTFAIILAGLASMFAGAFSMSAASYLSAKSQREVFENEIKTVEINLKQDPSKFLKEMKTLLKQEGFDDDEVKIMCNHFKKHSTSTFFKNYIQKKLGLAKERFDLPLRNALVMFLSFLVGSLFPIAPFILLNKDVAIFVAIVLTILALFIVGFVKTLFTKKNWFKSGIEIAAIGLLAGLFGYVAGLLFNYLY